MVSETSNKSRLVGKTHNRKNILDAVIIVNQQLEEIQSSWQRLKDKTTPSQENAIQIIASQLSKVAQNLEYLETSIQPSIKERKLQEAREWMDKRYSKTFQRLANE